MRKQPLFIALSNQKGGIGKSSFTALLASYFHYLTDKNVLVVDCDFPQYSLNGIRDREMQLIEKNKTYKKMIVSQYERIQKRTYPIITSPAERAREIADEFLNSSEEEYDVVIFDLPGTVNSSGILRSIINMDYIFTPICADKMVMHSSLSFATTIQDFQQEKNLPLKDIYLFWNMIDKRASPEIQNIYNSIMSQLKINVLRNHQQITTPILRTLFSYFFTPFFVHSYDYALQNDAKKYLENSLEKLKHLFIESS